LPARHDQAGHQQVPGIRQNPHGFQILPIGFKPNSDDAVISPLAHAAPRLSEISNHTDIIKYRWKTAPGQQIGTFFLQL
jgi:hypothetical protein